MTEINIKKEDFENDFYLIAEGIYQIFSPKNDSKIEEKARKLTNNVLDMSQKFRDFQTKLGLHKLGEQYPLSKPQSFSQSFSCGSVYLNIRVVVVLLHPNYTTFYQSTQYTDYTHATALSIGWTNSASKKIMQQYSNPIECLLKESPKAIFNLDLLSLPASEIGYYPGKRRPGTLGLDLEKYLAMKKKITNEG